MSEKVISPAEYVIDKFDKAVAKSSRAHPYWRGAMFIAAETGYTKPWIRRWLTPKSKGGTDGKIPKKALPKVLEAAKRNNIKLSMSKLGHAK